MRRISSRSTFFMKRVFPLIWFGFLIFFVAGPLASGRASFPPVFFIAPLVMVIIGYIVLKKLVWNLADEVTDLGDSLLVRRGAEEERVPISRILNVSVSAHSNPQRITLRLARPGKFGDEIAFAPVTRFSLNPFAKSEIFEDLIVRVDRARSSRAV